MDGLECTEIRYSQLNQELRIDSQYFNHKYSAIDRIFDKFSTLEEISDMKDVTSNGSFKYVQTTLDDNEPKTIPYIRSGNVGNTFINKNDLVRISEKAHKQLRLSHTKLHDVMMARKGKIGGASIITESEVDYNCNENVVKITITDKRFNPFYFTAFFNSKYGLRQIERLATGNVQPWLSMAQIRKLKIQYLGSDFQNLIEKAILIAVDLFKISKKAYESAEEYLLEEIGINIDDISNGNITIKSFAGSFGETGRLDAEYYQPKYDALIKNIKTMNYDVLSNLVYIRKSIEPGSNAYQDSGIPFIRVSDISIQGITQTDKFLEPNGMYDIPEYYLKKNEILFSKDGSVGIAYKVDKDIAAISSSALLHLTVIDDSVLLEDYLTLLLNSKVVQMQAERDAGGSIIQHWKPSEIEQVLIPIIDYDKQIDISNKVKESFSIKEKADRLLKDTIKAVEMAIEQDEATAIKWLDEQMKNIISE